MLQATALDVSSNTVFTRKLLSVKQAILFVVNKRQMPDPCHPVLAFVIHLSTYSIINPSFISARKEKLLFSLIYLTFQFNYPAAMLKETKKIGVDLKSGVAKPQYHIIKEPSDGRPEFLVIEVNLPGIVSTC